MRGPLSVDDVEFIAHSPEQHRALAEQLISWAEERHPDDDAEVTPADLLVRASEHLGYAGDPTGALDLARRAAEAEGSVEPDVRCYLHHALIKAGDVDGAHRLAEEVRRSRPSNPDVYVFIGETYEVAGDLAQANRWFNLGLTRLLADVSEGEEALDEAGAVLLLAARRRVRRELGFPTDEYDDSPLLPR